MKTTAAYHRRFKAVTAMSPLQYQKQIRLQDAQYIVVSESADAASAGYAVGYGSPSQFSWEYHRMFGTPPRQHTNHPHNLTIATKVGARRGEDGSWIPDFSPASIRSSVEDNLRNLKLESLNVVNLRVGGLIEPAEGSIAGPLSALESMQREGLLRNIGLSNVSPQQYEEGREIVKIVCVQNHYNVAHREDDTFIDPA